MTLVSCVEQYGQNINLPYTPESCGKVLKLLNAHRQSTVSLSMSSNISQIQLANCSDSSFAKSARGDRWGANADTAGDKRRAVFARNSIFINGDISPP